MVQADKITDQVKASFSCLNPQTTHRSNRPAACLRLPSHESLVLKSCTVSSLKQPSKPWLCVLVYFTS